MSNRLTHVPDGEPPNLPSVLQPVVFIADAFMFLMASRPRTGSLQHTWVTPATKWLCFVVAVGGVVSGIWAISAGASGSVVWTLVGAAVFTVSIGCAAVWCVAVAQSLAEPR